MTLIGLLLIVTVLEQSGISIKRSPHEKVHAKITQKLPTSSFDEYWLGNPFLEISPKCFD